MTQPRFYTPHPAAPPGYGQPNPAVPPPGYGQPNPAAPPMPYTPHPLGHGHHNPVTPRSPFTPYRPLPVGRRRSDDWIHSRLRTPIAGTSGADGFTPNWLMNALPQIKIEIFKGPSEVLSGQYWC
jgi:hypothetical protein